MADRRRRQRQARAVRRLAHALPLGQVSHPLLRGTTWCYCLHHLRHALLQSSADGDSTVAYVEPTGGELPEGEGLGDAA